MGYKTNYNERSWSIDLIGHIKAYVHSIDRPIKEAGGETSIIQSGSSLFPDVLLFADSSAAKILQGWELKMPDTSINDKEFYENAKKKAKVLGLDSFILWNVKAAHMYVLDEDSDDYKLVKAWDEIPEIISRTDVQKNVKKWKSLAISIIDTVNDYIDDGYLKGKRFIEAYSSGGITSLILENTNILSDSIQKKSNSDKLFRAKVQQWQDENCQDYGNINTAKTEALARSILSNWTGKFLFAHVLTSKSTAAKEILYSIDGSTSVDEAVEIFEEISKRCNFWTIFSRSLGMNIIPEIIWNQFLSFNNLLKDLKIGEISQQQLSTILEDTVSINSRKLKGQYTTPEALAKLLVALTLNNIEKDRVADFCSGSGTIIRAVFEKKLKYCPAEEISKNVYASDSDYSANQITTFALAKPSGMDLPIKVFNADIFSLHPNYNVSFRDPRDGSEFNEKLGLFDVVLGNLPFISQKGRAAFAESAKEIISNLPKSYESIGVDEPKFINMKSDIYAYIPTHLLPLLKEKGCLGIIISNSWLGTDWGVGFLYQLITDYHLKTVITSGAGRWFSNSQVVTNMLILVKRAPGDKSLGSIDFVTLKRPLVDLEDEEYLSSIASQILLGTVSSSESLDIRCVKIENLFKFLNLGVGLNSQFCECDWLFELPLIKLSTYLESHRGSRRGWDELFYPSSTEKIEPEFLEPVLLSSRNIKGYLVSPEYTKKAFCCSVTEDELLAQRKMGAYEWIQRFKKQKNTSGKPLPEALKQSGVHWYEFGKPAKADFVLTLNPEKRFFIAKVQTPSIVNQRLICLKVKSGYDSDLLHALLNSVVTYFMIEVSGFGRGLGALDLKADVFKSMYMLDISKLTSKQIDVIKNDFKPLLSNEREVYNIDEELESEDRINFDKSVLKAFGVEHLQEEIYESLLKLVSIRLEAKNIY